MSHAAGKHPYRLVVFDWDGTLIDSIGTIVACTRAVFAEFGMKPVSESRVRSLIGTGLRESILTLVPDCDEATLGRVIATYRRLWVDTYHRRSDLIAGAREVLEQLRDEDRLLAVATAKARRGLNLDLERLSLGELFDTGRTADEAPSKPSPVMLLEILDELGIRPEDALMVGDSTHDILMAHNAGVAAVAVSSGAASRRELLEVEPRDCLETVRELPAWMEQ